MPTSSVLINPVRLRNIRDINPRDLIERVNQTIIKNVLNDELDRPGSNPSELVPDVLNVVYSSLKTGFQVLNFVPKVVNNGLDVIVIDVGHAARHVSPFIANPGEYW